MSDTPNLFADIPSSLPEELFTTLLDATPVRIERIVSHGQSSPDGLWSDPPTAEWVVVLRGAARLRFESEDPIDLAPGAYVNIPAHRRHRVEWTTPDEATVWLAIHY